MHSTQTWAQAHCARVARGEPRLRTRARPPGHAGDGRLCEPTHQAPPTAPTAYTHPPPVDLADAACREVYALALLTPDKALGTDHFHQNAKAITRAVATCPPNAVIDPGEPGALPTYFNAGTTMVPDQYCLGSFEWFDNAYGKSLNAQEYVAMQGAALAITHAVVWSREGFEFGKIGDRWYLLSVLVAYDPENDPCG